MSVGVSKQAPAPWGAPSRLTSMARTLRIGAALSLIMVAALAAAMVPAPGARAADARVLCGTERWTVKTLQDRPSLLPVQATTINFLVTRPAPHPLPEVRLAFERHVYRVTAAVTLVRAEDDGDFHLVLRDGSMHMIAEAPASGCIAGATPRQRSQMRA